MELSAFCGRYNISPETFVQSGLDWVELQKIGDNFNSLRPSFESVGKYLVESLLKCGSVHSINYRIKESDHLLEKIIRKKAADPVRSITIDNYRSEICDLVGIRVLHLFKEDWAGIHQFITGMWELSEQPVAYVRPGDSDAMIEYYRQNNCTVREHKYGYRSVHYVLKSKPDRDTYLVEVQARTMFEEAWGEIDHVVRYPYQMDNEFLVRLSSILNRLAGNADELGSYMRYLKGQMDSMETEHRQIVQEKNELIESLRKKIDELGIDKDKKDEITSDLRELEKSRQFTVSNDPNLPWLQTFMESRLFKGITTQLDKFVKSEYFTPIEITETDADILEKTRNELFDLMRNPENLNRLMHSVPVRELLSNIEISGAATGEENREEPQNEKKLPCLPHDGNKAGNTGN